MKQWICTWTARMTVVAMLSVVVLSSCSKEEDVINDPGIAPTLPPSSSFIMDFSTFPSEQSENGRFEETKLHYAHAGLSFLFWQSVIGLQMIVPVAAFQASFDQEAVYIPSEQQWNWSYEVAHGNTTYQANLYAKPLNGNVDWKMYISKSDAYEDFLWFQGTSAIDGSNGTWTVSVEPAGNAREALFIDWKKTDDEVASIRYTVIDQSSDQEDSYIEYGKTDDDTFDSYYWVFLASENNLMKIDYNSVTKAGRVQNPGYFEDDDWRCWSSDLVDTDCSN